MPTVTPTPVDILAMTQAQRRQCLEGSYFNVASAMALNTTCPTSAQFLQAKVTDLNWGTSPDAGAIDQLTVTLTIEHGLEAWTNGKVSSADYSAGYTCNGAATTNKDAADYWADHVK